MPRIFWTRKQLVFIVALVSLACVAAVVGIGLGSPDPLHSATLGPQWQCSRLAFVFTICSRVSEIERAIVRAAREPGCRRRGPQAALLQAPAGKPLGRDHS